jgi:hypothetical protein
MALKEFNFKQFLLQRGEWLGLGFALVITLPVLGIGVMKILGSPSPTSNAMAIEKLTRDADQRIQNARPPDDADKPPKEFFTELTYAAVDPDAYSTPEPWFVPSSLEDTKRRSPDVLPPADLRIDVVRGAMKGYIITPDGKKAVALKDQPAVIVKNRKTKKLIKLTPEKLSGAGSAGYRPSMPGGPGGERGFGGPMGPAYGAGPSAGGLTLPSSTLVDIDKIDTTQNIRLAEEIYPLRMAVVTGSFPFKQQMEEFRRALKKRTLDEVFAMFGGEEAAWEFRNFRIQRRVLYPDGRVKTDWQDYDDRLNSAFAALFARAVDYEKDDADLYKYEGVLSKGLAMVRPQLERGQYPKEEIKSIKDAIAALDKLSQGPEIKRPLSDLARKLQKKGANVYDPFNPLLPEEQEEANKPATEKPNQPSGDSSDKKKDSDSDSELLIPEKALVRFIDVTVEPGFAYEYRIKVRMANPNYKQKNVAYSRLAEMKDIEASEWTPVPRVEVPHDIYYYAMDEKPGRENTIMQIHRWVDYLFKDPQDPQTRTPLGDWTIAEKLPVRRGEYIGRLFEVKVPLWNVLKEDFEMAVNPKNKFDHKIAVDFTVRTGNALDPALLVDYQGGKDVQDRLETRTPDNKVKPTMTLDSVPVQILILTPEGRLVVRTYQEDNSNQERIDRHKAWKEWISDIENGRRKPKQEESFFDRIRGGGGNN